MKKFFTFVFCAFLALPAFSTVLLKESFDRNVGNLDSGSNTSMGNDKDNWWLPTGTSHISVVDANLTYVGYCDEPTGKAIQFSGSNGKAIRALTQAVTKTTASVYYSCLINVTTLKDNTSKDYIIALLDNGSTTAKYCFAELRTINNYSSNTYQLGITKAAEAFPRFSKPLELNTTYLVVVRYDFVDGDKNDRAYLWINPTSESSPKIECAQDTANGVGEKKGANTVDDATNLTMCYLKPGTNTPTNLYIDEIKVATTWADLEISDGETPIVKPELEVNPSSLDFGKYISGQTYSKTFTVTGSNLTNNISIGFYSPTANISINPTSISKDNENLASGVTVTVTVEKERQYDFTGTIVVSSGDLSKNVSINGTEQVIKNEEIELFSEFTSETETEDVIFTYTGTTAKISSINEGYKQITLKDVSSKMITVQIADEDWEDLNPVIDMKVNGFIFTAEIQSNPITGNVTVTAQPTTLTFKNADFEREVTSLNIGTICLKGMVQTSMLATVDATFYKILYKEGDSNAPTNIVFEEVTELEENMPYIFQPNSIGTMKFYTHNANTNTPGNMNGLYGTFEATNIEPGLYLISNNMICKAGDNCDLAANRAYIKMDEVPVPQQANMTPGRRTISLTNPDGYAAPTGCQNIKANANYRKAMIDGQIVIMNNGNKKNIFGQTIK